MADPTYILPQAAPVLPIHKKLAVTSEQAIELLVEDNNRLYEEVRQLQLKLNQTLNYLNQKGI
jgi:hypothetical protein